MRNPFKALWKDERGNVLIMMGAALPVLIGAAGLATDTIQWVLWKRELQRAADSAAIAGVYERNATANGGTENVATAVTRDLTLNQHLGALDGDPVIETPDDDAAKKWTNQVGVTLTYRKELAFSSMFVTTPAIVAYSKAASVPGAGEYCVIALDDRNVTGLDVAGSTTMDLGDCCMIANATESNAAFSNTGNGSSVTAGCIAAVGGVAYSNSSNWHVKNYFPYSEPAADPYLGLTVPTSTDCTSTWNPGKQVKDDTDRTSDTGIVCVSGGFTINATLNLGSATYVIDTANANDDLTMNANGASLNCNGCTIILTNSSDPTKTGNFKMTGGTVNVRAPTDMSNPYHGIAFYQDRRAADDLNNGANAANKITGNNTSGVRGVIYIPNRSLQYIGNGSVSQSQCMQIVGRRVSFSGNSKIKMGSLCGDYGYAGQTGGGWLVRLVA